MRHLAISRKICNYSPPLSCFLPYYANIPQTLNFKRDAIETVQVSVLPVNKQKQELSFCPEAIWLE